VSETEASLLSVEANHMLLASRLFTVLMLPLFPKQMKNSIELQNGGTLLYDAAFLDGEVADRFFAALRDQCAWEQKPGIFGHMQPRLIASYGDPGVSYRYSGITNIALPWIPVLLEIKQLSYSTQWDKRDPDILGWKWNSHHHGRHYAAVLATRGS